MSDAEAVVFNRALEQHIRPLKEEIGKLHSKLDRLEATVHTGDKDRGLDSLTHRVYGLEKKIRDFDEKEVRLRAWVAGFSASLALIAALAGWLGWQGIARLNQILEALGGS